MLCGKYKTRIQTKIKRLDQDIYTHVERKSGPKPGHLYPESVSEGPRAVIDWMMEEVLKQCTG